MFESMEFGVLQREAFVGPCSCSCGCGCSCSGQALVHNSENAAINAAGAGATVEVAVPQKP